MATGSAENNGYLISLALAQTNTLAVFDVDGWKQNHNKPTFFNPWLMPNCASSVAVTHLAHAREEFLDFEQVLSERNLSFFKAIPGGRYLRP